MTVIEENVTALAGAAPISPEAKRRRKKLGRDLGACWDTIEIAGAKLDLDPQALRARCRRAAKTENGQTIARLGMGVVAKKLGTSWRIFVPSADQSESGV
jgi:hypothetical protein